MTFTASYTLDPALIRRSTAQWLWSQYGAFFLALATVVILLAISMHWRGLRVFSAICLALVLGYVIALAFPLLGALRVARRHSGVLISLTMDEDGVDSASALSESRVPWSSIRRAVETRDFLYFERAADHRPVAVPRSALSSEAISFAEERVRTNRGGASGGR